MRAVLFAFFALLTFSLAAPVTAQAANEGTASVTLKQDEARIPFKTAAEGDGWGVATRVLGGFVVVALLAVVSVYVLKRFFPALYTHSSGGGQRIQVLEIRRLTPKSTLFLIEVDGARMLLAQSGDQMVKLRETPTAEGKPHDTAGAP